MTQTSTKAKKTVFTSRGVFKRWYTLAKPNKKIFALQSLLMLAATACFVLQPVFAAYVISSLVKAIEVTKDYTMVYVWLIIGLASLILRQILMHLFYLLRPRMQRDSFMRIQNDVFSKVFSVKEENLKSFSMEKLISMVNNDIIEVANFTNLFILHAAKGVRIFVFLILTATISWIAALMGLLMVVINYFMLDIIGKKNARVHKRKLEEKDEILKHISEVVKARDVARDFALTDTLKKEYEEYNSKYYETKKKEYFLLSMRDQFVFAVWNTLIVASSIFLVYLVSQGNFLEQQYLLATGYLLSCVTVSHEVFEVLVVLNNTNISALRINTFLNLSEKEVVQIGRTSGSSVYDQILLNNVCFSRGYMGGEKLGKLVDASLSFPKNTLNIVHGASANGKRAILYILRRKIRPDSGVITVDGIEVSEYTEKAYSNIVTFANYDPFFLKGSILKNFLKINSDENQIYKICEMLGIKGYIETLPNGFDTDVTEHSMGILAYQKFMMGLAASVLSGSRYIFIYGVPLTMTQLQRNEFAKILEKFKKIRTIVLILPSDQFAEIADNVYSLDDGVVSQSKKYEPTENLKEILMKEQDKNIAKGIIKREEGISGIRVDLNTVRKEAGELEEEQAKSEYLEEKAQNEQEEQGDKK